MVNPAMDITRQYILYQRGAVANFRSDGRLRANRKLQKVGQKRDVHVVSDIRGPKFTKFGGGECIEPFVI